MATSKDTAPEQLQLKSLQSESGDPLNNDDAIAWEPADNDLWIPYRIRGSWRGGVLG
jgi:hypothetical protein